MQFNTHPVGRDSGNVPEAINSARNLYEITENIEEYYKQKAPNLWNAWVRTNNMLVEQQEKIDKLEKLLENQQQNQQQTQTNIENFLHAIAKNVMKIRENQEGKSSPMVIAPRNSQR